MKHSHFPHDRTADQFYDPSRFESYRSLGFHIADTLCNRMPGDFQQSVTTASSDEFISAMVGENVVSKPQAATSQERPSAEMGELVERLNNKKLDSLARGYAARELADAGGKDAGVIDTLIEGLIAADVHFSEVARQSLVKLAPANVSRLRKALDAKSQSKLLPVIKTLEEIVRRSETTPVDIVKSLAEKLEESSKRGRDVIVRLALLDAIRVGCESGDSKFLASTRIKSALNSVYKNDKNSAVRDAATRTMAVQPSK